ncbi:MAG TPA: MFS transporter [Bryobacteraceae bacterium]|jgi:EmrB/QacA subfamily drug resistance transporter|nr:MFS transporter [Bryobacteraceae bacterium]
MAKLNQTEPNPTAEVPASTHRSVFVALLVAGAFFMENLDGTVIATALPQMAASFGVSPVDLNLGMTAYMLTLAVFIPVSGWVADRLGARTVFSGAIALFTFASILCGISNGLWEFTAARILQGIGGAMMVPVGRLVVLRITEKKDLMRSIAYITWPGLMAPVIGPPVGGFITTYSSWRWIFFLNVPLGVAGIILATLWITNEHENAARPFDWLGFALAGSACTSFMYSLELLGRQSAHWSTIGLFFAYGVLGGWMAVRHMRRTPHPLIEFATLKVRTFAIVIWGGSLFRIAISVSPFLLPLMFQVPFGMSAFQSGLLVLAMFAGNLSMKTITTPVLRRFGFRSVLIYNGLITGLLILSFSFLAPQTPRPLIVAVLFMHGLSRSMQFTCLATLAFVDIPKSLMSSATSFISVVTQLGMGMGVAVGAVALRLSAWIHSERTGVPTLTDFHVAFALVSMIAVIAVIDCFGLERNAGAEVSGHR